VINALYLFNKQYKVMGVCRFKYYVISGIFYIISIIPKIIFLQ